MVMPSDPDRPNALLTNDAALSLLDSMWAIGEKTWVIKRRLAPLIGHAPTSKEIAEAAMRFMRPRRPPIILQPSDPVKSGPTRSTFTPHNTLPDDRFDDRPLLATRPPSRTKLVKPRSHPAPAGGFSMLGGRAYPKTVLDKFKRNPK